MGKAVILALASVLVVGSAPLLLPGSLSHTSGQPLAIDQVTTHAGADTYMFSILVEESDGIAYPARDGSDTVPGFTIRNGSFFKLTARLPSLAAAQDIGILAGVVRFERDADCPGCFMDICEGTIRSGSGVFISSDKACTSSAKDDGDVRLGISSTDITLEENHVGQGGNGTDVTVRIDWAGRHDHPIPGDSDRIKLRVFVSIPGATEITAHTHIHSTEPITVHDDIAHDGGFLRHGSDYQPVVHADTVAASAMVAGETVVTVPESPAGQRMYATQAPSWFGTTVVSPPLFNTVAVLSHNTLAVSDHGVEKPNGNILSTTSYAALGTGGIDLVSAEQTGDYRFFVNAHAGIGPQDLFAVGFVGPLV